MASTKLNRFFRNNGFSWHNIKCFPRTAYVQMTYWQKHWRKSYSGIWRYVPKMWDLFPISVSCFVYDKTWDELGIGWKILNRLWTFMPLWHMKNKPDEWQKLVEERREQC